MRKFAEIPPAPKSARAHTAVQEKGCPGQRVVDGQTLGERKQHMEQEENLGVKILGLREPKLEKEVEQKAFKKGTGETQGSSHAGAVVVPVITQN